MAEPNDNAIVIGAGCVGISTAFELSRNGYSVTLLDKFPLAAQFASMGNAGLIRPRENTYSSQWKSIKSEYNLPSLISEALKSLWPTFKPNYSSAAFIDPLFFTEFTSYKWGLSLLKSKWIKPKSDPKLLESYDQYCMDAFVSNAKYIYNCTGNDYLQNQGYANIYPPLSTMSLTNPNKIYSALNQIKAKQVQVNIPNDNPVRKDIDNTKIELFPNAFISDCHSYSNNMIKLKDININFRANTEAKRILMDKDDNVYGVLLDDDSILPADTIVICGGVLTNEIIQNRVYKMNHHYRLPYVPIVPLQGFSITIPYPKNDCKYLYPYNGSAYFPSHVYANRINDHTLRFTSYGYFRPTRYAQKLWDNTLDMIEAKEGIQSNIKDSTTTKFEAELWDNFQNVIKDNLLELYDIDQEYFNKNMIKWRGLRPYTPDGLPIVDKVKNVNGLYINAGHGTLGWNRSHGTAKLIANMVNDTNTKLEKDILSLLKLDRF